MTRINIIPPQRLYDQHLIAEYREIFMVAAALKRSLKAKKGFSLSQIPKNFTLGKGYIKFFYDKGKYLYKRYTLLTEEMESRGFKPNIKRRFPSEIFIKNNLFNDWQPRRKDFGIILMRLKHKISLKPAWYRKTKNTCPP